MRTVLNSVIEQAARELSIEPQLAELIYRSYWKFIKDTIQSIPIEEMSENDFENVATNFNIPYIGKLYTGYEKTQKYKRKINYLEEYVKVKRNKADVQSGTCD